MTMKPPPSHDIQIQALLNCRAPGLTREWTGNRQIAAGDHKKVFTVSRSQVQSYVKAMGVPRGGWSDTPGSGDGLYMVEDGARFSVYLQDRGCQIAGSTFRSRRQAEIALTNWLLATSGTGLFSTTYRETGFASPLRSAGFSVAEFIRRFLRRWY
jgi:hypothetical protein